MKFLILIDYANLFINIKNNTEARAVSEIEHEIGRILTALKQNLSRPSQYSKKGITVIRTQAFVLDEPGFGRPEDGLANYGVSVTRVNSKKKTDAMKAMNQSRDDDDELMKVGLEAVRKGEVEGVLVVSNDGDFSSLGEKIQFAGRLFWVGAYEGRVRASGRLRRIADAVLPLHELVKGVDEGIALPLDESTQREQVQEIQGAHLNIYYAGKVIMRYPVKDKTIEIGRRSTSRFHYPHVDLTDHDTNRIVSRQHAKLQLFGNRLLFTVHDECTRGTWRDGAIVYPCEQFFVDKETKIVIGSNRGFGIQYIPE
ncbi:hypothetical protein PCCS19_50020 [Paenibacillus sp. CCS19]|uniref:NYN domain-containing protein n=1 Tax=Paenibacillus sp. CCS19 TaxID=3158387 RepID=UPI00256D0CDF|nr:FHA domain-containing protein [Paenibacillus cellulosilyticus]GMK41943.1 hypothetical protein PCCS19_50020 [Paenibacillus cellulosilyticus]